MQIVPGYYLRRNLDGFIEHSTCANNTASEHYMVERLIVDDLLHWATNYKVPSSIELSSYISHTEGIMCCTGAHIGHG